MADTTEAKIDAEFLESRGWEKSSGRFFVNPQFPDWSLSISILNDKSVLLGSFSGALTNTEMRAINLLPPVTDDDCELMENGAVELWSHSVALLDDLELVNAHRLANRSGYYYMLKDLTKTLQSVTNENSYDPMQDVYDLFAGAEFHASANVVSGNCPIYVTYRRIDPRMPRHCVGLNWGFYARNSSRPEILGSIRVPDREDEHSRFSVVMKNASTNFSILQNILPAVQWLFIKLAAAEIRKNKTQEEKTKPEIPSESLKAYALVKNEAVEVLKSASRVYDLFPESRVTHGTLVDKHKTDAGLRWVTYLLTVMELGHLSGDYVEKEVTQAFKDAGFGLSPLVCFGTGVANGLRLPSRLAWIDGALVFYGKNADDWVEMKEINHTQFYQTGHLIQFLYALCLEERLQQTKGSSDGKANHGEVPKM